MAAANFAERLEDYTPSGDRFVNQDVTVLFGIDSDGCVDRGMRYKHGGPFPRAGLELFDLMPIAEPWRIAWSYVNEIEERGCPRFEGLAKTVDRVLEMPVVKTAEKRGIVSVPRLAHLHDYLENVAAKEGYGDALLQRTIDGLPQGDQKDELTAVAAWSRRVNSLVDSDCPYIEPYDHALSAITMAKHKQVDCIIVSGTPEAQLKETWKQHGLTDCVRGVFGRESGKKNNHLVAAMEAAKRDLGQMYDVVIMFGDAPGDERYRQQAAEELGIRIAFMPIRAGHEEEDWGWFHETILEPDAIQDYSEAMEEERIQAFHSNLDRPWNPNLDITSLFQQ